MIEAAAAGCCRKREDSEDVCWLDGQHDIQVCFDLFQLKFRCPDHLNPAASRIQQLHHTMAASDADGEDLNVRVRVEIYYSNILMNSRWRFVVDLLTVCTNGCIFIHSTEREEKAESKKCLVFGEPSGAGSVTILNPKQSSDVCNCISIEFSLSEKTVHL